MLHTHSITYHPHYIMFPSQHFCFPRQHHSTNAPHPSSSQRYSYQKDTRPKPGNLKIQQCPFGYRRAVTTVMLPGIHNFLSFLQFRIFFVPPAIQERKQCKHYNHKFACCFGLVLNLVSHFTGKVQTEGAWEQGAEGSSYSWKGRSDRILEIMWSFVVSAAQWLLLEGQCDRQRYAVDESRNAYRVFDTWDGKGMLGRPRHRRDIIILH